MAAISHNVIYSNIRKYIERRKQMRIVLIISAALFLSNCTSSYVKNKKIMNSPNDLQKFTKYLV